MTGSNTKVRPAPEVVSVSRACMLKGLKAHLWVPMVLVQNVKALRVTTWSQLMVWLPKKVYGRTNPSCGRDVKTSNTWLPVLQQPHGIYWLPGLISKDFCWVTRLAWSGISGSMVCPLIDIKSGFSPTIVIIWDDSIQECITKFQWFKVDWNLWLPPSNIFPRLGPKS